MTAAMRQVEHAVGHARGGAIFRDVRNPDGKHAGGTVGSNLQLRDRGPGDLDRRCQGRRVEDQRAAVIDALVKRQRPRLEKPYGSGGRTAASVCWATTAASRAALRAPASAGCGP